jgi:hypothetical protein
MAEELNNENTVHDATTGFNDIKAVPGFFPQNNWPYVLIFLFLLVYILRLWKKFKPKEKLIPANLPSALEILEADLLNQKNLIEAGNYSSRQFSSELSLAIRKYFSGIFQISTEEQTVKEAVSSLRNAIKQNRSWLDISSQNEIVVSAKELLSSCEFLTFADTPELSHSELVEKADILINGARALAKKLEQKPVIVEPIIPTEVTNNAS